MGRAIVIRPGMGPAGRQKVTSYSTATLMRIDVCRYLLATDLPSLTGTWELPLQVQPRRQASTSFSARKVTYCLPSCQAMRRY